MSFLNRKVRQPRPRQQDNGIVSPQTASSSDRQSNQGGLEGGNAVYKLRPSQLVLDFRSNDLGSVFLDQQQQPQQVSLVPRQIRSLDGENGDSGKLLVNGGKTTNNQLPVAAATKKATSSLSPPSSSSPSSSSSLAPATNEVLLPPRERCLSDGDESLRLVSHILPPITSVDRRNSASATVVSNGSNNKPGVLSIKSITKSSVSSGSLMAMKQSRSGPKSRHDLAGENGGQSRSRTFSSSYNFTQSQRQHSSALLEASPSIIHPSKLRKETASQTDFVAESELFPECTNEVLAQSIRAEYSTPGVPSEDEDSEMEQLEWLAGVDASLGSPPLRPSAPDVEMMACGQRLGRVIVSPLEHANDASTAAIDNSNKSTLDDSDDPDVAYVQLLDTPPPSPKSNGSSNFRIMAPAGCRRPKPRRFLAQQRVYVEYHPTSPPSSERTVPSETGSETSSYFSAVPSSISSPDSTKIINLLLNKRRSAFYQPPSTAAAAAASAANKASTPTAMAPGSVVSISSNPLSSKATNIMLPMPLAYKLISLTMTPSTPVMQSAAAVQTLAATAPASSTNSATACTANGCAATNNP